jgi:hypothetical protein
MVAAVRKGITFNVTHHFLSGLFGEDVHAKRIKGRDDDDSNRVYDGRRSGRDGH